VTQEQRMGMMDRAVGWLTALNWHAVRLYYLSNRLWVSGHRRSAQLVACVNRILTAAEIPPSVKIGPRLVIMHGSGIVIHSHARLGADCVIYQQVTIGSAVPKGAPPTIGDRVSIYPGARVVGGITIGDGARIGANTVVMRDVAPGETVRAGTVLHHLPAERG
jgi:serine O-acetyltransferase